MHETTALCGMRGAGASGMQQGKRMDGPVEWFAAIGTVLAAGLIAADIGRRATGWAFVLFVAVSIAWVGAAVVNDTPPLAIQNAIMICVNGWGVWQYLLNPRKKREIERAEEIAEEAKQEIAAES